MGTGYTHRTLKNVRGSQGTVVISLASVLSCELNNTISFAKKHRKPVLHISKEGTPNPKEALLGFVRSHGIRILNVAGPRASKEPEVAGFMKMVLGALL